MFGGVCRGRGVRPAAEQVHDQVRQRQPGRDPAQRQTAQQLLPVPHGPGKLHAGRRRVEE